MSRRVVLLLLLLVALVAALVRSAEAVCLFGLNLSLLLCTCDYADVTCDGPLSGLLVGEIPVGATSFTQINNPGITALASRLLSLAVPTLITLYVSVSGVGGFCIFFFFQVL
ncbi:hypothetical protein CAOG_009253 [Capsaspora owczarzaki ATCC 30864]|uniref:LRRNT domain-containing protein n=1 Tax=Capsaspora owczarzaki (strain ATCC 30864) TaxID=595528 RepID=A0A0D2TZG2_CAPO3|nr:hypothetical protein CAOG_009253 [Capsaspora owczarzaki ATCC 30864]